MKPIIEPYYLESICQTIASTTDGLTGAEIGKILIDCRIIDTDPSMTKWKRLYNAFVNWQNQNRCSDHILNFIKHAFQPVRYLGKEELFEYRRHEVNKRLSFIGVEVTERGTLRQIAQSSTISEAEARANHFKYKLLNNNAHPDIIKYCNPELLAENYFHSVFEGVKSVAERLRAMTGLYADGNSLVDIAFSTTNPLIRINLLQNDTHRSEHIGLSNLIKGLFGIVRNPTAHIPKIKFVIEENEALDIMTTISFVHKKLDKAL